MLHTLLIATRSKEVSSFPTCIETSEFYKDIVVITSPLYLIAMIVLIHCIFGYTRGFYKGIVEYKRQK